MKERDELGELLALVVHDLRNPVATISANVSYVKEAAPPESRDLLEALDDVEIATADLTRGLEQLGWIARWMSQRAAVPGSPGDARAAVREGVARLGDEEVSTELPDIAVEVVVAGEPLARLVELLARNSRKHARTPVTVHLSESGVLEVRDGGTAVGEDLRPKLFTMGGQQEVKGRVDGRYARVVGLLAARAIADGMGVPLKVEGDDGAVAFRVDLTPRE